MESFTSLCKRASTAEGNVFDLTQMSRIFLAFSCEYEREATLSISCKIVFGGESTALGWASRANHVIGTRQDAKRAAVSQTSSDFERCIVSAALVVRPNVIA